MKNKTRGWLSDWSVSDAREVVALALVLLVFMVGVHIFPGFFLAIFSVIAL